MSTVPHGGESFAISPETLDLIESRACFTSPLFDSKPALPASGVVPTIGATTAIRAGYTVLPSDTATMTAIPTVEYRRLLDADAKLKGLVEKSSEPVKDVDAVIITAEHYNELRAADAKLKQLQSKWAVWFRDEVTGDE